MAPFDWHGLWVPSSSPVEVVFRATMIYFFTVIVFRAAGRKELSRYATHDVVLWFLIATATRQTIVGKDTSLTSGLLGLSTMIGWHRLLSHLAYRSRRAAQVIDGKVRRHDHEDLNRVRDAFLERSGRVTFVMHDPT